MKTKYKFLIIFCMICCFSVIFATNPSEPAVDIGIQSSPASLLLMVAKEQKIFDRHAVNVRLKEFSAGKFALQAFLAGSLDAVVSGELPVLLASVQGNKVRVVSQVVERSNDEIRVIVRKDGNEKTAEDFFHSKKRTLATSFGGGPEYFTYNFLKSLGISPDQVRIINQKPEDMPAALASGSLDAISIFDPFAYQAEKLLGNEAVRLKVPVPYMQLYVLSMSESLIEKDSALKILSALKEAAFFVRENPDASKAVLQKYTKLDSPVIEAIWPNFTYDLALSGDLLDTWKNEIEWQLTTRKISGTNLEVNQLIDGSLLKSVEGLSDVR